MSQDTLPIYNSHCYHYNNYNNISSNKIDDILDNSYNDFFKSQSSNISYTQDTFELNKNKNKKKIINEVIEVKNDKNKMLDFIQKINKDKEPEQNNNLTEEEHESDDETIECLFENDEPIDEFDYQMSQPEPEQIKTKKKPIIQHKEEDFDEYFLYYMMKNDPNF